MIFGGDRTNDRKIADFSCQYSINETSASGNLLKYDLEIYGLTKFSRYMNRAASPCFRRRV